MKTLTLRGTHSRRSAGPIATTEPSPSTAAEESSSPAAPAGGHAQRGGPVSKALLHGHKLTCAACDRQLHDHGGSPPDCDGFVRPVLTAGFAYADSIRPGTAFSFLHRGGHRRIHVLRREPVPLSEANGLLELSTTNAGGLDGGDSGATYLVDATTIVQLSTAPALLAA